MTLKKQPLKPIGSLVSSVFLCASGPKRGVGRIGYVPIPSLGVHFIKGRTLGREKLSRYVDGSQF